MTLISSSPFQMAINLHEWESDAVSELSDYEPFDQKQKLGESPYSGEALVKWEKIHGHDARMKCYAEYGCQLLEVVAARRIMALIEVIRDPHMWGFDGTDSHFNQDINPIQLAESEVRNILLCGDKNGRDVSEIAEDVVIALRELGWTPPNLKNRVKI